MYIFLRNFSGMMPRYGEQNVGDEMATDASNCLLLSGELRGLHSPSLVKDFTEDALGYAVNAAFHIFDVDDDFWVPFEDAYVHFQKGPLVNDAYDRYYWTSSTDSPRYDTKANIIAGATAPMLGVEPPQAAPGITPPSAGTDDLIVTRAYVITYVTQYGEEGPPSDPAVEVGPDGGTWVISSGTFSQSRINDDRPLPSKVRIYRTITGQSGATDYHFVAEVNYNSGAYNDTNSTEDVALNDLLGSYSWYPPPDGYDIDTDTYDYAQALQGIVQHPNGFLVGYVGRDLYFSEAYRPHAWPPDYVLTTQDEIVGLGVFGTAIVIATKGYPYICDGINPAAMTFNKLNTPEPCQSHFSIVSMPYGVMYASENGLVLVDYNGSQVVTTPILTRDEWRFYNPSGIKAARFNDQYLAFFNIQEGFMYSPNEPQAAWVDLHDWWDVDHLLLDQATGDVIVLVDDTISRWNPPTGAAIPYLWQSKEFDTPRPVNFGAFKVQWYSGNLYGADSLDGFQTFNTARLAKPLHPINHIPLNGTERLNVYDALGEIDGFEYKYDITPLSEYRSLMPIGGSVLYDIARLSDQQAWLRVVVTADDVIVFNHEVEDNNEYRIPSGFKAERWQITLQGTASVKNLKMAETVTGLSRVGVQ